MDYEKFLKKFKSSAKRREEGYERGDCGLFAFALMKALGKGEIYGLFADFEPDYAHHYYLKYEDAYFDYFGRHTRDSILKEENLLEFIDDDDIKQRKDYNEKEGHSTEIDSVIDDLLDDFDLSPLENEKDLEAILIKTTSWSERGDDEGKDWEKKKHIFIDIMEKNIDLIKTDSI